jgi:hypothetical protein
MAPPLVGPIVSLAVRLESFPRIELLFDRRRTGSTG